MLAVFIHGLAASREYFAGLEMDLAKSSLGLRTYSFDLLGFGANRLAGREFSLEEHLAFIRTEIDAARQGNEQLILIGHSLGGVLALAYAEKFGGTDSLVLINTPLGASREELQSAYRREHPGWMRFFTVHMRFKQAGCAALCRLKALYLYLPWKPGYLSWPIFRDYTRHTYRSLARTFEKILLDYPALPVLQKTKIPVLRLYGSKDLAICRTEVASSRVKSAELPAGHHLPLQNRAGALKEIRHFLHI